MFDTSLCRDVLEVKDFFHINLMELQSAPIDSPTLNYTQTVRKSLQSVQKTIRFHHCNILAKFCILDFFNFLKFQFLKMIFKCKTELKQLSSYIQKLQGYSRSSRAATQGDRKVPFCRTTFVQRTLFVRGSTV